MSLIPTVVLIAVCMSAFCGGGVSAFTFNPIAGDKKCFTFELLEHNRYEIKYRMARSLTPFVTVALTGPQSVKMFSHPAAFEESNEVFTTMEAGEYAVCFNVNSKAAVSASRMDILFELMDERDAVGMRQRLTARNAQKAIATENSPSLAQASYIESAVESIHRDIQYLKQREADMRNTNEDTNTRAWAFTIITIAVVVASTFLRHYKLKSFLIKKKILD
jgi:p24 family protein delta-1